MAERHATLIVNLMSRRGRKACPFVTNLLTDRGWRLDAVHAVEDPCELARVASLAVEADSKLVIVGGGDGTVGSVADALACRPTVLGIIPLGTANSFARSLSIPLATAEAVDLLGSGSIQAVDLGKVGARHFLNGSSIGLPAAVAASTPHLVKKWFGRAGYLGVAAWRFATHRPFECNVIVEGRAVTATALDVRVASGSFQGGVRIMAGGAVDDGRLVVRILEGTSRWRLVAEWMRVALHLPPSLQLSITLSGSELRIATQPRQPLTLDGELGPPTPVVMSVARHALKVISGRPPLGGRHTVFAP